MNSFILISSLLLQLAFSAPLSSGPKLIFNKGVVTAESENLQNVAINHTPFGALNFTFAHDKTGSPKTDFFTFALPPGRRWSEQSFVIEPKPGHNCRETNLEVRHWLWTCDGELQIRELNVEEQAKSARTLKVLASLVNHRMKVKLTHIKGKQTIEGDFSVPNYVDVQNNRGDPSDSVLVKAFVGFDYNGHQSIFGKNLFSEESFVVESSNSQNCLETDLRHLTISYCNGYLRARKMTANDGSGKSQEERPEEDLPQTDRPEDDLLRTDRPEDFPENDHQHDGRPFGGCPRCDRSNGGHLNDGTEDLPQTDRREKDLPRTDRPKEDDPEKGYSEEDRPQSGRPFEDRPFGGCPRCGRRHGDRPNGGRPSEDRPFRDRPFRDRPQGNHPFRDRPNGDRPFGDRSSGDRPFGDRPLKDSPFEKRPQGDRPSENHPFEGCPHCGRPSRDRPQGDQGNNESGRIGSFFQRLLNGWRQLHN